MLQSWFGALPRSMRSLRQQPAAWEQVMKRWSSSQSAQGVRRLTTRSQQHGAANQFFSQNTIRPKSQNFFTPRITIRQAPRRGFRFSPWRRNNNGVNGGEKSESFTAKLRKLSREYGRAAVAVYFIFSILDYPFFFLLVRAVGTDRIGEVERKVLSVIPDSVRANLSAAWAAISGVFRSKPKEGEAVEGWGVDEAQERHNQDASLATQLALAYAIHKSFIFVRVPLTVAVTPRIVKQLRAWGWNIGKKPLVRRSP